MRACVPFRLTSACSPCPPSHAESDPRHCPFDFYAEQEQAPEDLRFLTDQYESLPFRRRG